MNDEMLTMFVEESIENVEELVAGLLRLESEGTAEAPAIVAELFRFAHNLKGMSATMGFDGMTVLAHRMEDLLESYRSGGDVPTDAEIDLLLRGCDGLSKMIDVASSGAPCPTDDDLIAAFESPAAAPAPQERLTVEPSAPAPPAPSPAPAVDAKPSDATSTPAGAATQVQVTLAAECQLPGARAAMVIRQAGQLATVASTEPSSEVLIGGGVRSFVINCTAIPDPDRLVEQLASIADVESVTFATETETPTPEAAAGDGKPSSPAHRATVRVEVERLDTLMDLVSELVIARGQLEGRAERAGSREVYDAVVGVSRLISDLQAVVASVRMVPLEATFRRLQRLARDTARDVGKAIDFQTLGAETELDRRMVDEVADPLVHLVRNAIDHGVESAERRTAADKDPVGNVRLTARHEGNQVVIEVSDDGGGIDVERVVSKAQARGLVTADEVATMTRDQKLDLIFAPGLSTRDEATTISGRGVGMDVVRQSINRLGGSVQVDSRPDLGSTFRIRLPMSLAVLEAMLVEVEQRIWAIPLANIDEAIRIEEEDVRRVQGGAVITLRGVTIPVLSGREHLAERPGVSYPTQAVVFRHQDVRYALAVDDLLTQTEVVVKPLPTAFGVDHVSGVTILGDGSVGLILDVSALAGKHAHGYRHLEVVRG